MNRCGGVIMVLLLMVLISGFNTRASTQIGLYTFSTRESNSTVVTHENPNVMLFVMMYGYDVWFAKYKLKYPEGLVSSQVMIPDIMFPFYTKISSYSYDDTHGWTVEYGDCPTGWFIAGVLSIECNPDMSGLIEFERFEYPYDDRTITGPIYVACG